eukprot:1085256-Rhodomonas_salina.1
MGARAWDSSRTKTQNARGSWRCVRCKPFLSRVRMSRSSVDEGDGRPSAASVCARAGGSERDARPTCCSRLPSSLRHRQPRKRVFSRAAIARMQRSTRP